MKKKKKKRKKKIIIKKWQFDSDDIAIIRIQKIKIISYVRFW